MEAHEKKLVATYLRGVESMIQRNPELDLQAVKEKYIAGLEVGEMTAMEAMMLNIEIQDCISDNRRIQHEMWLIENPFVPVSDEAMFRIMRNSGSLD